MKLFDIMLVITYSGSDQLSTNPDILKHSLWYIYI